MATAASPDKPVVSPSIQTLFSRMATDMWNNMPGVASRWTAWNNGSTVKGCQRYIDKYGLKAADFTTYSVTYADCGSQPWVFCYHNQAAYTLLDMADTFSKIPPSARGYVNVLVAIPKQSDGYAGWSTTDGDTAIMSSIDLRILAHEVSHHLDYDAYKSTLGGLVSENAIFQDEYAKDTNSVSVYAQSNWHETLAEVGSAAFYDKFVPGGFAKIHSKVSAFQHQLSAFENIFSQQMVKGGNCTFRKAPSPVVTIKSTVNSARFAAAGVEAEDLVLEIPEVDEIEI
ncbi:hypothetical protein GQ53DRAFT_822741 [Thozetella sp. PMI_491]|nr:hypothetical protein GQ53DRAFT_822741 [Thozetella sp. PMI_491]